ncbi:MAG: hypothetical protein R3F46_01280 [bacterium]
MIISDFCAKSQLQAIKVPQWEQTGYGDKLTQARQLKHWLETVDQAAVAVVAAGTVAAKPS